MNRREFLKAVGYCAVGFGLGRLSFVSYSIGKYKTPDEVALEIAEAIGRKDVEGVAKHIFTLEDIVALEESDDKRHKEVARILRRTGEFEGCTYDALIEYLNEQKDSWKKLDLDIIKVGYGLDIESGVPVTLTKEESKNAIIAEVIAKCFGGERSARWEESAEFLNVPGKGWKCGDWDFEYELVEYGW